jgi:hypothetical protein
MSARLKLKLKLKEEAGAELSSNFGMYAVRLQYYIHELYWELLQRLICGYRIRKRVGQFPLLWSLSGYIVTCLEMAI